MKLFVHFQTSTVAQVFVIFVHKIDKMETKQVCNKWTNADIMGFSHFHVYNFSHTETYFSKLKYSPFII